MATFAKVSAGFIYPTVTACGGVLFHKTHWVMVPPHEVKNLNRASGLEVCNDPSLLPESERAQCEDLERRYAIEQQQPKTVFFRQAGGVFHPTRPAKGE